MNGKHYVIYPAFSYRDQPTGAISTNQKPTIYRNLYENTGPELFNLNVQSLEVVHGFCDPQLQVPETTRICNINSYPIPKTLKNLKHVFESNRTNIYRGSMGWHDSRDNKTEITLIRDVAHI